ncbi:MULTISPECIES: SDR family oxidoreductase [unclassified Beijerinckia]|uniref:SDR family oxidoreductase n=1 Tax=unclassified Beijerinckia TaxID=2638183 RepID=UPI000895BFAE|nr:MULTISPECIES: SDR family oxidoreductase [unclassified Beijerinckia]MDH7795324.1 nucleoside-diphosphate-sugar epimerase [Beijerinckia sp. GAS462]SEB96810.1 Nucleoside-diphosphate-sugar epimerase [Beijerinckia sp. 28-YEA-48]
MDYSAEILITGATGLLGGAMLVEALANRPDIHWTALVRGDDVGHARARLQKRFARFCTSEQEVMALTRKIDIIAGDLSTLKQISKTVLQRTTGILHLAADTSFSTHQGIWDTNFDGTMALASLAHRMPRLSRFLHVSTATICGSEPNPIVYEGDYPQIRTHHMVEYTRAKAATEFFLHERFRDLPLIVARPSIVAGHTRLGARPSSSIFWFARFAEAVGLIPSSRNCYVDIVPSDWTGNALLHLLTKPTLAHTTYHLSAGLGSRTNWMELADAFARLRGEARAEPPPDPFDPADRSLLQKRFRERLGYEGSMAKLMVRAAERYYRFCSLNTTFDNSRLLAEGMEPPPSLAGYLDVCLRNPPNVSILDAFLDDAEMFVPIGVEAPVRTVWDRQAVSA